MTHCKKSATSENNNSTPSALTYEYQGQKYNGDDGNWSLITNGTEATGIRINRADLFGGELIFEASGCAYVDPHTKLIVKGAACQLIYDDSTAIDSSVIFCTAPAILFQKHQIPGRRNS